MENKEELINGYQTINNIFKEKTPFYIPIFQRGYRWTEDNVEKLIDDIFEEKWIDEDVKDQINKKRAQLFYADNQAISPYCIQPLAICEDNATIEGVEKRVFSVIDGQQRLTTLLIIISALKSCSKKIVEWPSVDIEYESRENSGIYLKKLFEYNDNESDIKKQKENYLDFQYMYNAFVVAQEMFQSRLKHIEQNEERENYIEYLRDIILYNTRFIWYKFDSQESNPYDIFDHFNTGKTSLTDSELIKAIFMDGNNYGYEDIDDKRIVISEKWDEMENELHDEEFWTFVPHARQYNSETNAYDTRIDIIFEYLVFRKWEEIRNNNERQYVTYIQAKKASSQDHYLFELVNRWVGKTLAKEVTENTSKAQIMEKCWAEVKNIYLELRELYKEDLISGNENQIYNMVGLYIKLKNIRTSTLDYGVDKYGNVDEEHQEEIAFSIYKELVNNVINKRRAERKNNLKDLIYKELGYDLYCAGEDFAKAHRGEKIEYAIKNINFDDDEKDDNRPAIKTLLAYNIALINQASGLGERFNFRALAKQTWQKEHIFACKLREKEDDDEYRYERRKKALEFLSKEDNDYINYVKYITGYKTKKDNPDEDCKKVWVYTKKNANDEEEKIILDEDDEKSVKEYVNIVGAINFDERDERDTKANKYRMAKALRMRELAKEKLTLITKIEKLANVESIDCENDANKMQLYLMLIEVQDKFEKITCFNGSKLQEDVRNEIKQSIQNCISEKEITVMYNNIETKYSKNGDSEEGYVNEIEGRWFTNYKESINKKYFTDKHLKAFSDIDFNDWKNLKEILVTMKESLMSDINQFFETKNSDYSKYLKDNSLGNLALLTAGTNKTVDNQASVSKTVEEKNQNSSVSDEPFYNKKNKIINFSEGGKFVPLGTLMVFSGVFAENSGDQDYWLHSCRKKYLENMILTMKKFLYKDSNEET